LAIAHDITSQQAWSSVVETAVKTFGPVNVLVNNAGILVHGALADTDIATLQTAMQVNLFGAFLGMQAVTPGMRQGGGGSIINIASGAAMRGRPNLLAYSTSKWALRGMSRCAALDLARDHIRVNAICPGVIDTPMINVEGPAGFFESIAQDIPLGLCGVPNDIASIAAFLASEDSAFITGTDIVADGGRLA
jgi:3alpha(or 20beta)-hydroxysteroid dehydrogenase